MLCCEARMVFLATGETNGNRSRGRRKQKAPGGKSAPHGPAAVARVRAPLKCRSPPLAVAMLFLSASSPAVPSRFVPVRSYTSQWGSCSCSCRQIDETGQAQSSQSRQPGPQPQLPARSRLARSSVQSERRSPPDLIAETPSEASWPAAKPASVGLASRLKISRLRTSAAL